MTVSSSLTSIAALPACVNVPEIIIVLSASNLPPLIVIADASVPVSVKFNEPAETVIAPESFLSVAIATGVILLTERDVIEESASISRPKLSPEVVTLSTVIEESRSLLF